MTRGAAAAMLLAVAALGAGAAPLSNATAGESTVRPDGGRDFELATSDGKKVPASWWYDSEPNGSGAVLLVATTAEREEWTGVVRHLRARGMNVLAVVVPALAATGADPLPLIGPAGAAADGAAFLVRNAKCDTTRIGVAGAGVSAVAVMDAVRRNPKRFRAAVLAGPDLTRFQPSQIRALTASAPAGSSATRVLLMEHAVGADPGVMTLSEAVPGCRRLAYDDPAPSGATPSWSRSPALVRGVALGERTVASFLDVGTGSTKDDVVLDGFMDDEAKPGGAWSRAVAVGSGKARAWAYRSGKRLVFGGFAPVSAKAVRLDVAGVGRDDKGQPSSSESEWFRRDLFDLRKGVVAWTARVPIVHADAQRLDVPPTIRAVACEGGLSFEGEWTGSSTVLSDGGRIADSWRALVFIEDRVPAAQKGDPGGNLSLMPVLPVR